MKVSVCITTYNHAPFIRQAIESVLMQQADFDFEILVGEDDSSDGTREIAKEYAAKHPGKIRLFLHDRKDVIHIKGRPTGRRNFTHNLKNAAGQYVALLEGDDYWTSPTKLQEQVDFLDGHPDYAICSHDVFILHADGAQEHSRWFKERRSDYDLIDLLAGRFFPPTCSVVFRNGLSGEFPDWFYRVSVGDFPLAVLNAQHGKIRHLDQLAGVYRQHSGGVWSQGLSEKDWPIERKIERNQGRIELYETLSQHLDAKYRPVILAQISSLSHTVASLTARVEDWRAARRYFFKGIKARPFNPEIPFIWALKFTAIVSWPAGYKKYRALKESISASRRKKPATKNSP